jgi:hypothetical protein
MALSVALRSMELELRKRELRRRYARRASTAPDQV